MKIHNIEISILNKYHEYLISVDPILNQVGSKRTLHTGGIRYEIDNKEEITPLTKHSISIEIPLTTIESYEIEAFAISVYEFTQDKISKLHRMIYQTINNITALTGNVVDSKDEPLNAEIILDMLDKIEIRFDEKGEPIKPQFVASPNMIKQFAHIKFTPEQEERHKNIIERKKKEYYAKKRYRQLSYID